MHLKVLLSLVIFSLLSGCASPSPSNNTATTVSGPANENTTLIPVTNTLPSATSTLTPTATATPIPLDFNAQNFNQFTGVISYGSALAKHFNKEMFDIYTYAQDYSADGSTIAIGGCIVYCSSYPGGRDYLLLVDTNLVKPILEIPVDTLRQIWDVDLNPDGSTLIFSIRGQVLRYDRATGQTTEVYTTKDELQVPFDSISPDGKTLVIVTENELLALNLLDGSEIIRLNGNFWGQNSPFFNAQGNRFLVYSQQSDRDVIVYDTDSWTEMARFPIVGTGKATVSTDGKVIATLSENDTFVKLYNIESGSVKDLPISPYTEVASLTFNPANDLLLTFGNPGDLVDFFEGVQVIDLQNGKVIGSLTQEINPGRIKFSADGKSFLRLGFEATNMALWSLPTPDILKIETLIQDYFAAVSSSDFLSAADMTFLDSYAREEVVAAGLNPEDLPATFTALCKDDEVPCLPLKRIVRVMADFDRSWDYYAIVTLEQPDGSEIMFDDYTPFELLGVIQLENGSFKISTLHPGMRYPYQE